MAILVLLVLASLAREVIAAPGGGDQPAPETAASALVVVPLLLAPLAAGLALWLRWYRLPAALDRPEVFPAALGLALFVLAFVIGAIGVRAALVVFGEAPSRTLPAEVRSGLAFYAAELVVVVVYVTRAWSVGRRAAAGRPGRDALVGLAALAVCWPLMSAAGWVGGLVLSRLTGDAPDPVAHETLRLLLDGPRDAWFLAMGGLVVVVAPVVEEVLYRGLLQDAFRRAGLGPWAAVAVGSAVFAAMHWQSAEPHAVAGLFVLSLGFGWAFERTGRLTAPILMHVIFNAGNLALAMLVLGPDAPA